MDKAEFLKRKFMLDIGVFIVLLAILGLSTYAIHIEPPSLRAAIHVGAAVVMSMLAVVFYMQLGERSVLVRFLSVIGFAWMVLMIVITMGDYLTRASYKEAANAPQWNNSSIPLD